jgi:hypothetical protein
MSSNIIAKKLYYLLYPIIKMPLLLCSIKYLTLSSSSVQKCKAQILLILTKYLGKNMCIYNIK